jgi:hypothetical protein
MTMKTMIVVAAMLALAGCKGNFAQGFATGMTQGYQKRQPTQFYIMPDGHMIMCTPTPDFTLCQ